MQRKEFLKRLGISSLIIPLAAACANESEDPTAAATTDGTTSTGNTNTGTCAVSPTILLLLSDAREHDNIKFNFDPHATKNSMVRVATVANVNISLGSFGGRIESNAQVSAQAKGVFAFVIEGAFEFVNRLLQFRDALLITDRQDLEFESLSNEGILLLLEVE